MKKKINRIAKALLAVVTALALAPEMACAAGTNNPGYTEMNLVSDTGTNALRTDPNLVNAWGIVAGTRSVWVNANETGLLKAYSAVGKPGKIVSNLPAPGGGQGAPTGLALNDTSSFLIPSGPSSAPAAFLIATEDGTILAWNRLQGSNAVAVVDRSGAGAVYKGLAIAGDANGAPRIYAADFHNNEIDEFDGNFNFIQSFTDSNAPGFFAPFNIRTIRERLFVTFAMQLLPDARDDQAGPGNGFVDIFDTDGTLLRRFAAAGALNSPWGMAVAPKNFGKFSHALLIGNFGDGKINAYDLLTGKHLGSLQRPNGDDLVVDGLWGLTFEKDEVPDKESLFDAQRLYFTAGPNDEADGLLGILRPVTPSFPPAR